MLEDIRNRITRLFSASSSSQEDQAAPSRQHRAQLVTTLQQEIRNLQHEISELSEAEGSAAGGLEPQVDSEKMAILHSQLTGKQAELSRYQARV